MKNILTLSFTIQFLFLFCFSSLAQDTEYLIPVNTDFTFKGYGGIEIKRGNLIEESSTFLSLKGGAVINNKVGFGLTAGAFLSDNNFPGVGSTESTSDVQLSPAIGYGGIFVEYIALSSKKIHFSVPVTIGPGIIALSEELEISPGVEDEDLVEFSPFFVIEPGINLEVNLLKEVKFCIGGCYRLVSASDLGRVSDSDLSDFMFNIGLKIGNY